MVKNLKWIYENRMKYTLNIYSEWIRIVPICVSQFAQCDTL